MTDADRSGAQPGAAGGTWSALENTVFRNFWLFSFLAFVGAAMQTVGAGWLMTELDPSPARVALVQAAFSLSAFVMGLPAGVLADIVDRRYVILAALGGLMLFAGLLGLATLQGMVTPNLLLLLTFLFGLSAATVTPAMQATTPDLVPRLQLPSALTLNGMNNSIARAVGPGLAGLILGAWGAGWMFVVNVFAFVGLFFVVLAWRNTSQPADGERRGFAAALVDGLVFSVRESAFRWLLIKMMLNFLMISILLALMPSVVDRLLDGRPQTLGLLLASFGLGSVSCSLMLSRLYARLSRSRVVDLGAALHAVAVLLLSVSASRYLAAAATFVAGLSWTAMLTSVNIVAQMLLPARVRARGLSINMMGMMGSLALGAALWGQVAQATDLRTAFMAAGIGGLLMPLVTSRIRLVEALEQRPAPEAAKAGAAE